MYSPASGLLAALALMRAHRAISGTEIARRLKVDARTIRRYVTALQDMGSR